MSGGSLKDGKAPPIFGTTKTSVFLTNAQSRFAIVVLDGVLGPPRLSSVAHLTVPCFSVVPDSTYNSRPGLFELTRRPSRALVSPRALLLELRREKVGVRCVALGAEVPGQSRTTDANLDCV